MIAEKPPRTPWGQTTLGAITIAVGACVVGSLVAALLAKELTITPVEFALFVVAAFVLASLISKKLRGLTWVSIGRFFLWLGRLQVTTLTQRIALDQAGYSRRSAEINEALASTHRPVLSIRRRDDLGEVNMMWLENSGHSVNDVQVSCDPAQFTIEGRSAWTGGFGTNMPGTSTAVWFKGIPTKAGKANGVDFDVSWIGADGNRMHEMVHYSSRDIDQDERDTIERARRKGYAEGRAAAVEEAKNSVVIPLPLPRWWVHFDQPNYDGQLARLILKNLVDNSVARNVRIDAASIRFTFLQAGAWDDLSGLKEGRFAGAISIHGRINGVPFKIGWYDEMGVHHTDVYLFPALGQ